MQRRRSFFPSLLLLIISGSLVGVLVMTLPRPRLAPNTPVPTAALPLMSTAQPVATMMRPVRPLPDLPADTVLLVPAAAIYVPVVQVYLDGISWDVSKLGRNAGHLEGTPLPAEGGNTVLSGHVEMADGSRGPFIGLRQVALGDLIELRVNGRTWRYTITAIEQATPDMLTYVMPTTEDRLTLITCGDYDFISNAYPERLVIIAAPLAAEPA